jgi:glycosyltransferase involved in cell wall biosynthesis
VRLRVLHVDSGREWRGGQNQVLLSCLGMKARGHEVALACRRASPLHERAEKAGLEVAPVDFGGELSPRPAFQVARALGRLRPAVVQAHDPHALTACHAARIGGAHAPLVATRRVDFRPRGPLAVWKYQAAVRVVVVSRAIHDVMTGAGVDAARLRLVYEGVPDRAPAAGGQEALRALGIPAGVPVIGNVAALVDHKDHPTLLRAAARVLAQRADARFVIVGDGERRDALAALARDAGIAGSVTFTGFRDDVDRLLPAFDVFCLSSHMEGLGTIVLDAMAFARPVVATAAGGIPESVVDGVTGRLTPTRDDAALAAALLELIEDPARALSLGQAGRRRFEECFSAERMVAETLAVYAEVA